MGTKNPSEVETREISVNEEKIIERLIEDQAGSLTDGIREGVQNGIDAPSSSAVVVSMTPERTIITDDGEGIDFSDEEASKVLSELGLTTKADDDSTIGLFGIGTGQMLCKAKATFHSGDYMARFDYKNRGVEFDVLEAPYHVDGMFVTLDHYADEVPAADSEDWNDMQRDVEDKMEYIEIVHDVKVIVNGDRVSDDTPEIGRPTELVRETEDAYIALRPRGSDKVGVYSAGLLVGWMDSHGVRGKVVTKKNLDLNSARDQIKSGCPIWSRISDTMDEMREEIFDQMSEGAYTEQNRAGVARLMLDGKEKYENEQLFKTPNGTMSKKEIDAINEPVVVAEPGDQAADKLAERGYPVLLSDDEANQRLKRAGGFTQHHRSVEQLAVKEGLSNGHELVDDEDEWPMWELKAAQMMLNGLGVDRKVMFGEDETAKAWTDGESYVVITRNAWSCRKWEGWLMEIWTVVCHEAAHSDDSKGQCAHGRSFLDKQRRYMERQSVYTDIVDKFASQGIGNSVEHVQL